MPASLGSRFGIGGLRARRCYVVLVTRASLNIQRAQVERK
jgi:hypothetical protein